MSGTKRSALVALLAASRAPATQAKPSVAWNECLDLESGDLNHKVHLLWTLVAELDAGRCKTIGAHQLGNLLEKLAPLQHRVLLDSIGQHFIQRLTSYGLSADYLNATSVLSQPLICWFASHGCTGACRKLLAAKANPDVRELNFEAGNPTALLLACRGGFADCVEALIEGGADPHLTDDFGITPFHEAASSPGSTDHTQAAVISVLLQHPSAHKLLHKVDAAGQSPLAHAAALGFTACVKLLLEAYSPFLRAQLASKALVIAAEAGRTSVVEALIAAGAVSAPDSDGPSALEWAAEEGHIGCVALMLRSALKKSDLANALLAAAKHGHEHIMHLLVEAGGSINQPGGSSHTTPLMAAAGGGHLCCAQQLLERHANASYSAPDGTTALMAAASGGHTQCVAALIIAGAALNSLDQRGMSAIMLAAAAGHVGVLHCLMGHKAALERLSSQGSSPLVAAAAAGQGGAMQDLLEGGALVDAPSSTGETAMMVAASHGHVHCMEVLQACSADLDVEDNEGSTALDSAVSACHQKAITFLLLHGAQIKASSASEILQTLSSGSRASSQWDVLQMLSQERQLVALLATGDFIALPLGSRPCQAAQVRGVHGLLRDAIMSLMRALIEGEVSDEQGCALIQGLDCWARLVKQQRRSKQRSDAELPLFRELCHTFSPMLCFLCGWATNQLETLADGAQADPQADPQPAPQLANQPPTRMSDRQRSADQMLSGSCGHAPVHLTRLSIVLSSVEAAARGGQSAWTQQTGVHQLLQLMQHITKEHGVLINLVVDEACRADAKQACVIWSWTLSVEGLLHGGSWQGLLQGALQALRAGRHMAMWVPRQDMLEDLCHGFVAGTGFASDISAGLEVQFINEGGIGSGVRRDWLNSMMTSMLDPQTGLFESCDGGHSWQPCPLAHMQEQHLVYFEMLGRAMGLALLHGEVLPGAHFTPNFLKSLLGQPSQLDDLRGNPPVHGFLKQLAAGQFRPEDLCLTFSCSHGVGPEVDLVPQGSQIEVTTSNWREYYKQMLAFKLHKGIEMEVGAVRKGFQHIVDDRTMQLLRRHATPEIMDQLLAGEDSIDVQDWQANTLYKNCTAADLQVDWFWQLLGNYSQSQLEALLAFVTCSPAPPAGGFARLAGFNGGRHLFEICLLAEQTDSRLPRAATCFNTLYLPQYSSKSVMQHRLEQACSAQLVFDEGAIHEVVPASLGIATSPLSSDSSDSTSWEDSDEGMPALVSWPQI